MFIQPIFDSQIEQVSPPDLARALGFDVIADENGIDEESALGALYHHNIEEGLSHWSPEIPDGYVLGGKYESDDGPFAFFVKPNSGLSSIIRLHQMDDDEINLVSHREPTQKEIEYGKSLIGLADKHCGMSNKADELFKLLNFEHPDIGWTIVLHGGVDNQDGEFVMDATIYRNHHNLARYEKHMVSSQAIARCINARNFDEAVSELCEILRI